MNTTKINKKAQTEIIGLIIIVSMLLIIMLIARVWLQPTQNNREFYLSQTMAQNFMDSILKIYSGCQRYNFLELMDDCATNNFGNKCIIYYSGAPGHQEMSSCQYLKLRMNGILQETFKTWGYGYGFEVKKRVKTTPYEVAVEETKIDDPLPSYTTKQTGFYSGQNFNAYLYIYTQ